MGKTLELSEETYKQLVDLAQQQQRTPEEMLCLCLPRMRRRATSRCIAR